MGPLRAPRHSLRNPFSIHDIAHSRSVEPSAQDEPQQVADRHEPQTFTARALCADPYTAWLEQREADREREGNMRVRWIYRQRAVGGPAIRAGVVVDEDGRGHDDLSDRLPSGQLTTV
jgi:hypothetical protein